MSVARLSRTVATALPPRGCRSATVSLTVTFAALRLDRGRGGARHRGLVEALDEDDRALWATAFYAGLRLGELRALRDEDVDLEAGLVPGRRRWCDPKEGPIEPKSRAGRRVVPIVALLRSHLAPRKLRRGGDEGLFFGEGERPFDDGAAHDRARKAWRTRDFEPIGFHEASRRTCASIFIAAGVNAKALSTYLGHPEH